MNRLRNKIAALFLFIVVAAIAAATYVTTRNFVQDKQEYLMVLNSVAAPNVASAIGKHLDYLQNHLLVFNRILESAQKTGGSADLLQASFRSFGGIQQIAVYDRQGLVANIGDSGAKLEPGANPQLKTRVLSASGDAIVFTSRIKDYIYLVQLTPALLGEYLQSVKALSVSLVSDQGKVVLRNDQAKKQKISPEAFQGLLAPHSLRSKQQVIAKEMRTEEGIEMLSALAPIPETEGMVVVVQTPSAQASQMIKSALQRSLPLILAIVVLALAVGFIFSMKLVKPIEELTEATSRIAHGEWEVKMRPKSRDEVGRLVRAFTKMGDELAERERQLKKANEDLVRSEKLAVLGKFGAGVAHEVKNPLNSILGYAQLLQKRLGENADDTIKKYLGFLMDETRRASRIITDLLTFSRQKPPTLHPSKVSDVVHYAYEMISPQAESAKVKLLEEIQDAQVQAKLDRDQIFQVLLNLSTNAMHALEEKADDRKVKLGLYQKDGFAILEVEDNGCGIPAENLKRLFEPFFSTKGVGKGTGLGLSLCHGIIQQHGGKIEVSSVVGQGTKFSIYLPSVANSS